jgi:predicted amidohydrolase
MWVSAGCLEKDGNKVYNSAVIIDRTGRIVLKQQKIDTLPWLTQHLYDRGNPGDIKTVDTEFGRIGPTICADNFNLSKASRVRLRPRQNIGGRPDRSVCHYRRARWEVAG